MNYDIGTRKEQTTMTRVLLDASFVISAVQSKTDILKAILDKVPNAKLAMPVVVFEEVERKGTKLCVTILEHLRPTLIPTIARFGDDAIIEIATTNDYIITLDKELKTRAKEKGIRVLTLRQRKYVEET